MRANRNRTAHDLQPTQPLDERGSLLFVAERLDFWRGLTASTVRVPQWGTLCVPRQGEFTRHPPEIQPRGEVDKFRVAFLSLPFFGEAKKGRRCRALPAYKLKETPPSLHRLVARIPLDRFLNLGDGLLDLIVGQISLVLAEIGVVHQGGDLVHRHGGSGHFVLD